MTCWKNVYKDSQIPMTDVTIIYYTSNREDPKFERKVQESLLKNSGGLPIISVSQKPISLGTNICVGDVGHSYLNEWRQILMGVKEVKTSYVVFAEADFLYPKEYFLFKPKGADVYRYDNIWIIFAWKYNYYFRKAYSEGAQICKREYVVKILEEHLLGQPEWFDGRLVIRNKRGRRKKNPFNGLFESFDTGIPCISFKTGNGMRWMTDIMHSRENIARKLPYWGHIEDLKKEYL